MVIGTEADSVWAYLFDMASGEMVGNAWLFNLPSAPDDPCLELYVRRAVRPPVPKKCLREPIAQAYLTLQTVRSLRAHWSEAGVSFIYQGWELGRLEPGAGGGSSPFLREPCGWGQPLRTLRAVS